MSDSIDGLLFYKVDRAARGTLFDYVELERLDNVMYVGRPAFGQDQARISLFKLSPDRAGAVLVPVELGASSVNTVEVRRGLDVGDCVVLSDMSAWSRYDRLRISGSPACSVQQ